MRVPMRLVQVAIFVLGAVLLAFGIARGELSPIFLAATNTCLSCIGIG